MKKCRLDMTIEKNDLDALELAIAQTLAEDDRPQGASGSICSKKTGGTVRRSPATIGNATVCI